MRSRRERQKQYIGLLICFSLAMAPFVHLAAASNHHLYPHGPFGGGGGDAFPVNSHVIAAYQCGPWCGGFVGYLVGKAIDWAVTKYEAWWNNGQPQGTNPTGDAVGGGGGDTFYIEHK